MDYSNVINAIRFILEKEEPMLKILTEDVITNRFNSKGRSIKMLLGHLIDSASNNHQRMVRLQYDMIMGYTEHLELHIGHIHELMK